MTLIRRLMKNSLIYAIGGALQKLAGFLLIPLYTHVLAVESYGVMEVLTTLTSSAFVLATLGLPSAFNKCYHRDCRDAEDQRTLVGTTMVLLTAVALATVVVGLLAPGLLARGLLGSAESRSLVTLSLVSAAAYAVAQLPLMLLRARESSVSYVTLSFFQFLAMLGLNVWLVGRLHLGVKGVLLGSIGASGVTFLASLPFLARHASLRFSPRLTRALLMFGLPMVPVAVSGWVMDMSDRWLLQLLDSPREVGLYGLGYRYGMLVEQVLVMPFQMAWSAFYFREASRPDAREIYARVFTWFVVVGGWVTLSVALGGEIALRAMAERSYWTGASVIPVVALAYFLNGLVYCVAPGVHLGRKTHLLPVLTGAGALSNVALNFWWIPRYGRMGAAAATLFSFGILFALTAVLSRRAYGFRFEAGRIGKALLLLGAFAAIGLVLPSESFPELFLFRGAVLLVSAVWVGAWCLKDLGVKWVWSREPGQAWLRWVRPE